MNTSKFYYELMKLNVLSINYVDDSYKAAWQGNVYPFFHDSKYEFHYEVAKYFDRADEKIIDKLCSLLDDYVDERADFTNFEAKVEKVVGKGNVYYVLNYIFRAGQYKKLLANIRLNKIHFSQHFIDRFEAGGYFKLIALNFLYYNFFPKYSLAMYLKSALCN